MMKEKNTWEEILSKLKNEYKLSIKDICKQLKVSRSWANKYILPHIDSVYINSNFRDGKQKSLNWAKIASKIIGRNLTESKYFHEKQYQDLISNSICSITRQTIRVPYELLMDDSDSWKKNQYKIIDKYSNKYLILTEKNKNNRRELIKLADDERNEIQKNYIEHLNEIGKILDEKKIVETVNRNRVPSVNVSNITLPPINKWIAPHDIKNYGDTDEFIYRNFFKDGLIKIELTFFDVEGKTTKKVYYIQNEEDPKSKHDCYITVAYDDWVKYYMSHSKSL